MNLSESSVAALRDARLRLRQAASAVASMQPDDRDRAELVRLHARLQDEVRLLEQIEARARLIP